MLGRREERLTAAHAEADDEDAAGVGRAAHVSDRARDVRLDRRGLRLGDVFAELEVVAAARRPRGATEIVDGDRVHAGGGEALGELFVEGVQPAHVGRDDDAGISVAGLRETRAEARSVLAREDDVLAARAAGDRKQIDGYVGRSAPDG